MITYRQATAQDMELLLDLRMTFLREINGPSLDAGKESLLFENRRYFQEGFASGSFVVHIALDGAQIAATSGLSLYEITPSLSCPNGKVGYISSIYTLPQYRGQGIARALMEQLIAEAKARKCTKIVLNATDMGRPLYEAMGFTDTKNDMAYYVKE